MSIVVDPRFPGGTSSAVAREIAALAPHVEIQVYALETKFFKGRSVNARLQNTLDELGIKLTWNPKVIRGELVAFHNPSCLKFNDCLDVKIICDTAYIITHENFLRPCGSEGFDVKLCLDLLDRALVCQNRVLAPVSDYNSDTILEWLKVNPSYRTIWKVADFHWFNICDFELQPPTSMPRDRRGRHSRAGFEKFPSLQSMRRQFPVHAELSIILGGDSFLLEASDTPNHWEILPFGAIPVDELLNRIDFFVYYTHPLWRESFGRVIAEAIAAGKVVITDPETARTFGGAVVTSTGHDIDEIISGFLDDPRQYQDFVLQAQQSLSRFSSAAFVAQTLAKFRTSTKAVHDLL